MFRSCGILPPPCPMRNHQGAETFTDHKDNRVFGKITYFYLSRLILYSPRRTQFKYHGLRPHECGPHHRQRQGHNLLPPNRLKPIQWPPPCSHIRSFRHAGGINTRHRISLYRQANAQTTNSYSCVSVCEVLWQWGHCVYCLHTFVR